MLKIEYIDRDLWNKDHSFIDRKSEGFKEAVENNNNFYCYYDHPSYTKCKTQCKQCKNGNGHP